MSRSTDPGHFFQSASALSSAERKSRKSKNTHGNPIHLPSKILAIANDPDDPSSIYIAESAGTVRRLNLQSNSTTKLFTGPSAPLTSLAFSPSRTADGNSSRTLFAGCWDNSIWSWNIPSGTRGKRFIAHNDFVKCLVCVEVAGTVLLISGSADAQIIVWDVEAGMKLHALKGHARGILDLVVDPSSLNEAGRGAERVTVWSAGSEREVRAWRIGVEGAGEVDVRDLKGGGEVSGTGGKEGRGPLMAHETSVNKLYFDAEGDLWTASSDKSAAHLVREREWQVDTVLAHPDFVRDVVVDEGSGYVVTACRDEGVRVWDIASGELVHCYEGHFEEVTGLVVLPRGGEVVSVSIDGTVRRWGLRKEDFERAREEARREQEGEPEEQEKEGVALTEDEERELAELMEDD